MWNFFNSAKCCFAGAVLVASTTYGSDGVTSWKNTYFDTAKVKLGSPNPAISSALKDRPEVYDFKSQIDAKDSVSYTGQSFRLMVGQDGSKLVKSLKLGDERGYSAEEWELIIQSYYDFNSDAESDFDEFASGFSAIGLEALDTGGIPMEYSQGEFYDEVQYPGKDQRSKTAGNDNPLRRGSLKGVGAEFLGYDLTTLDYDKKSDGVAEPEDAIHALSKVLASRTAGGKRFTRFGEAIDEAYITENALDLFELHKSLQWGAVAFSQVARDYLSTDLSPTKGLNVSNDKPYKAGSNYTVLEHHFDEGFGYFGGARDLRSYQDAWLTKGLSSDTNGDGKISVTSEYNFNFVTELSQSKQGATLVREIKGLFLEGRHLITTRPEGYREHLNSLGTVLRGRWETGFAMMARNALVNLVAEYAKGTSTSLSFRRVAKHYSRAKGLALAFQFSPVAILSDEGFDHLHDDLLGSEPEFESSKVEAFLSRMKKAIKLLESTYEI